MPEHEAPKVGEEELEEQDGQPLPDREAMSLVTPMDDPFLPLLPSEQDVWTNDPVPKD
jgi:hypothetical protein